LEEIEGSDEFYDEEVEIEVKEELMVTDHEADSVTDSNQSDASDDDSVVGENPLDSSS